MRIHSQMERTGLKSANYPERQPFGSASRFVNLFAMRTPTRATARNLEL